MKNVHSLSINPNKPIFHKNINDFFSKYHDTHFGNTLLVDDTPYKSMFNEPFCCNPSLGLATKARACKVVGQEGSLGVIFHAFGSARKCEGMNSHAPK